MIEPCTEPWEPSTKVAQENESPIVWFMIW